MGPWERELQRDMYYNIPEQEPRLREQACYELLMFAKVCKWLDGANVAEDAKGAVLQQMKSEFADARARIRAA